MIENPSLSHYQALHVFPSSLSGIVHGYSTKAGGVSNAPYASLNLGDHVGDDQQNVLVNRELFSHSLGIHSDQWVTAEQVHGGDVAIVGLEDAGKKIPNVDALITNTSGLPLALMYADCASLYFYDPVNHAIGLAHAGWRGTAAEIARHTIEAMRDAFESAPEELYVALGPHIGSCCYTVGDEVSKAFQKWDHALIQEEGVIKADLGAANRAQLLKAGILDEHIYSADLCTSCHADQFFSYRRDGQTGRMAAALMLK